MAEISSRTEPALAEEISRPARQVPIAASVNHEAVRGVLILVVMFDHNDIIRNVAAVNAWFLPMTFHVAGFLLLPFLVPRKTLSWPMLRDHAIRYLTPFFFAVLLYAVAYHALVARGQPLASSLGNFVTALVIADPASLHDATGFIALWFMPALLSVVILLAVFNTVSRGTQLALLAATLGVHLTVGAAPAMLKTTVPQGWLIALYIFPLGLAARQIAAWCLHKQRAPWAACLAAAAVLGCWLFERGQEVEVATLVLPSIAQPLWVIATDISDVGFLVALLVCSPILARVPALLALGRFSLVVYLVHPLLYKPILHVLLRFCRLDLLATPYGSAMYWAGAALSVSLVGAVSLGIAAGIQAWPVARRVITPRGLGDWRNG